MIVAFLSNDCVQSFIRVGIVDSLLRSAAVQPPSFFLNLILVFPPHVFIMAVNVMAPDMRYLLEEKGVDDELINSLTASGITTISRLSLLEDTRAGMRKVIEQTFKLDPDVGNNRMRQVCLLDAWETATCNTAEDRRQQAEAKATRLPRILPRAQHISLRRATEAVFGELPDRIAPGPALMETILEMIEEGTLEAVPLTQVTCVEDGEDMKQGAVIEPSGVVRIKRGRQEVTMPRDSEDLRRRLRTWGLTFTYAKLKHPTRAWLSSATPEVIADYCDYLMGDTVKGLKAKNDRDEVVATPSFHQVLHYDFHVRKEQARLIAKGHSFKDALLAACSDYTIRERHFVTPLALSSLAPRQRQRSRSPRRAAAPNPARWQGASGSKGSKGGKGGKGSEMGARGGKSQEGRGKLAYTTPDGTPICFAYNNPDEKCSGSCGRTHVCRECFGAHPAFSCPGSSGSKGETGQVPR
jgi:hypothetical protein